MKIVFIIIILLIASGVGYYFGIKDIGSTTTPTSSIAAPIEPIEPQQTVQAIKLEPKNVSTFEKNVVTANGCNNPIGMVSFYDQASDSWMKINNLTFQTTPELQNNLKQVANFLQKNNLTTYQNINSFESAFREYCGGHFTYYIKELPQVTYPSVDQVRAIMAYTGQDSFAGITVEVFAKKGDNIIYLSKLLTDESLYTNPRKSCGYPEYTEEAEECYRKAILNDKDLESISKYEANRLISLFALN